MSERTIDEQLADEQKKFDARLAAEGKAERKAAGERLVPKTAKKRIPPKTQIHRVGEVAHCHYTETSEAMLEVDCLYVEHFVKDKKGFTINEKTYRGRVVVPQCTANYLGMMEARHRARERAMYENGGRRMDFGEIHG